MSVGETTEINQEAGPDSPRFHHRLTLLPGKLQAPLQVERPQPSQKHAVWGCICGIVGILILGIIAKYAGYPLLIGPFGASAVLLYGAFDSPLAQPRNLIGGHVISALIGVGIVMTCGNSLYAMALAVGLAILVMHLTHSTHPPGGATALIGVQSHASLHFVLIPVLAGALVLLGVAAIMNNIVYHRRYPAHWW